MGSNPTASFIPILTQEVIMAVQELSDRRPDGTRMGQGSSSTDKIAFFGAAVVIQQTGAAVGTDAGTTQTLANALRTALINLGLITTV